MDAVDHLKLQGNFHFQRSEIDEAIQSYTGALQKLRSIPKCGTKDTESSKLLESTILSNRAACYLKQFEGESSSEKDQILHQAVQDCTSAFSLHSSTSALTEKILYRRARAHFLLGELNPAAQDLLTVLSIDSKNVAASRLLQTIRQKHAVQRTENTPLSRLVQQVKEEAAKEKDGNGNQQELLDKVKALFSMLSQDTSSLSLEFGRKGGFETVWNIALHDIGSNNKIRILALQILACACSLKAFAKKYAIPPHFDQVDLVELIVKSSQATTGESTSAIAAAGIALFLRLVIAFDEEDDITSLSETEKIKGAVIDDKGLCKACIAALCYCGADQREAQKAALALITTWSSVDKESAADAILASISDLKLEKTKKKLSKMELNRLSPREFAAYQKKEYDEQTRTKDRSKANSLLFCDEGGLQALLSCAASSSSDEGRHVREVCVVIGRLLSQVDSETEIKRIVSKYVNPSAADKDGPIIEEIDDESKTLTEVRPCLANRGRSHDHLIMRGLLAISLFYANNDVGLWVLQKGLSKGKLARLIESGDFREMFIASEIVAACAITDKGRDFLRPVLDSGILDFLLESDNVEISSGAASAVAKLGMTNKIFTMNEGEMVGMLQLAVDLLYDSSENDQITIPSRESSSQSTLSTIERGVEILSFLVSNTSMKDEIAHGFKSSNRRQQTASALERLVDLASLPGAGESRYAYGLAVIFSLLSVSVETLRKEAFEGKDITLEEYNQLQSLAKTQEEKVQSQKEEDKDSEESVKSRIRKMAAVNVPRGVVMLLKSGASESTQEQLVIALNRMAIEETCRGIMIQQGCLNSCLKIDKDMEKGTELQKRIVRHGRHCIAKLLITTNPLVLTSAQLLGCIKPLIMLVHDNDSTDLQRFEALLSITNLASTGEEARNKIVSENGINIFNYAMFSEHELVRRAATEAMSNLFPHQAFISFLEAPEHLKLWVAFASDFEENFECARAAAGCLAMASQSIEVATALSALPTFRELVRLLLQCGDFELMHRILVLVLNMVEHGDKLREAVVATGAVAFCQGYLSSFSEDSMNLSSTEKEAMAVTLKLAKEVVSLC